jgi:UDP-N-acetylmuramoyl-tripeptide--D-alanyl-D-alanine ligase
MSLLPLFLEFRSITIDTRKIRKGDLFFALKGDNFNGNDFAIKALEMGASRCIVDDESLPTHPNMIFVKDVLIALQTLARQYRDFLSKPVIALTGSNGKTTTKELINSVLSQKFKVCCTKGNLNNHIGVPLTILSASESDELLLIEMGANHQGEVDLLANIANPDIGLITNIGKAHLEGFGGIEGVKKGKSELYKYLAKNGGKIFCYQDDEVLKSLLPHDTDVIFYGDNFEVDHSKETLVMSSSDINIKTNLFGAHNKSNVLVALALGQYFGIELCAIVKGIESYIPNNNRSQVENFGEILIIKDSYNSNPSSLKASLTSLFTTYESQKIVIILGDMLELGEYSEEEHIAIVEYIDEYKVKESIYIGEQFDAIKEKSSQGRFFRNVQDAKVEIDVSNFEPSTIVFLKGSRGIAVEKLLG